MAKKMTREEAIEQFKYSIDLIKQDGKDYLDERDIPMLDMAIKALEQEPRPMEKFESAKDHIYKLAGDYKCWDNRLTWDEALELCHILEQEPILDKIRAEIDTARFIDKDTKLCKNANASGLEVAMEIIDKYKAESEDNNETD